MNKKAAEILAECGYARGWFKNITGSITIKPTVILPEYSIGDDEYGVYDPPICDPFADTLESRRQADAIGDYFANYTTLWGRSRDAIGMPNITANNRQLDRIKWCLEQS